VIAYLALSVWVCLLVFRGRFWREGPVLQPPASLAEAPEVAVVVPARNEADVIEPALRSLLAQDYPGAFGVVLVDDGSTDGTATRAAAIGDPRLTILAGKPKPAGWSGKLWALAQGVAHAEAWTAPFILLTDADIVHKPQHLSALVAAALRHRLDLVSEMVELSCQSLAEHLLVPAFVYFFALLYPFAWVRDPRRSTAAAAGGTMLIRREALARAGGIAAIRGALIDDVALASAVKPGGAIWLSHSQLARSIRAYPGFADIWRMVARTAYVQLRHSPLLLALTTVGLGITFLAPPLYALFGDASARLAGSLAWAVMAVSYLPTLRRFRRPLIAALALPLVALFYMAATIGSAVDHMRGRGARWKERAYA
jgi:hopene-associated glycosyltransferase HpnB